MTVVFCGGCRTEGGVIDKALQRRSGRKKGIVRMFGSVIEYHPRICQEANTEDGTISRMSLMFTLSG
jgi:hypothetical protein